METSTTLNLVATKNPLNREGSAPSCQEQASSDLLYNGFDHVLYPTIPMIAKQALHPCVAPLQSARQS
jgi:hypothetical protein